jgi:CubicO group peptidase (beta-lactamase class C family)
MNIKPFVMGIEKEGLNVEGIIVSQGGKIIAQHRWIPESPRIIYSVSKSFTSIGVGMAVDEGKLKLKDKVLGFFPQKKPQPRLESLNVEHLLTMTRGHCAFTHPETVDEALSHELEKEPGECFNYDNACTFLLSAIVTKVTGKKLLDYLIERLFRPLGIPDPVWAESKDGYNLGGTGLELRTSDMELFGRFLLYRGNWEGRQLVSAAWIDGATRTQVETRSAQNESDWGLGYGWQFWTCRHGAFRGDGMNGQYIIVIPRLDAVIAVNSNEENMKPILGVIWEHILPLF